MLYTPHASYLAHETARSAALAAPSAPVSFPITLHGTFTAYAPCGYLVTKFVHKAGPSFDTWEEAQAALAAAEGRRPHYVCGGFTKYYLSDALGAALPSARDGWKLNAEGVPVTSCSFCGHVGPHDADCCTVELF